MPATHTIRILESEANRCGDLFGRLMEDLFFALGYGAARLNIHKSGREIDLEASHRTEQRRVVAECKATDEKTGGGDVNKFFGTLDAERRKAEDVETVGYFVSLAGFRETAIEQERDIGGKRLIMLHGAQVIGELITGHIIVSPDKAMERAGRCAGAESDSLRPEDACELLAHEKGWIWAIYFALNKQRTHFALIHADGEPIAPTLAESIIQSDKSVRGQLESLTYLPPQPETPIPEQDVRRAEASYLNYLASECGEIQLEGMPADEQVGSRRFKLESLFVPLHLEELREPEPGPSASAEPPSRERADAERRPVGQVLSENTRLAVLADPGGGKSTLLKRLAVAYAFPRRRAELDDNLPERPWLPIFMRCRHLGDLAFSPVTDVLAQIPARAEMPELASAFSLILTRALQNGQALLLIDGLDEISDPRARVALVRQLCTFLSRYPAVSIIVTSREAGFRVVGGALTSHCAHYKIAEFDNDDIRRLVLVWHQEVLGNRPAVRSEATELATSICSSDRLRRLAQNPLLLTTLLLVKRWVGQLPTRRVVLYGKAIEVLLMTWNVEAHEPIDREEAIPQLAFVAFTMMKEGVQQISRKKLQETLELARRQMPEILAYAKLSVSDFIEHVELRSSILMLSGHVVEDGTLTPTYEFRHLTFQEYLAAVAVADGYYPGRADDETVLAPIESHLEDESWAEVVSLAAVLAGRRAEPLVRHLIDGCKQSPEEGDRTVWPSLLAQCIYDEIQISPERLRDALEWIARHDIGPPSRIRPLVNGRYAPLVAEVVENAYMAATSHLPGLGGALGSLTLEQLHWSEREGLSLDFLQRLTSDASHESPLQAAKLALATMEIAYQYTRMVVHVPSRPQLARPITQRLSSLAHRLLPILNSNDFRLCFAACWALAWLGGLEAVRQETARASIPRLLQVWRDSTRPHVHRQSAWAIAELPVLRRSRSVLPPPDADGLRFLSAQFGSDEPAELANEYNRTAALVIGFYWRSPWEDEQLAHLAAEELSSSIWPPHKRARLLRALGEPGRAQLAILNEQQKEHAASRPRHRPAPRWRKRAR